MHPTLRLALALALIAFPSCFAQVSSDSLRVAPVSGKSRLQRVPTVAVLPFVGAQERVVSSEAANITGRIESELMSAGKFRVLDRRNMDAILREQGFQQSGACTTDECQVQVGQLLGVERIIVGEIFRSGDLWSLSAKMVDVGSGEVLASHILDIKGNMETVLKGGCPEMASILAGTKHPVNNRTVLEERRDRTWLWIAGGALVAAGGVTAAVLLSQNSAAPAPAAAAPKDIEVTWTP